MTGLLKLDGENELMVLVRGDIALAREDYVDRYNPDAWIENDAHRDYPPTDENVACALGSVWLRALPAVRVRQTLVVPDVENDKLLVFSRVQNMRNAPCTVELRYAVSQEGKAVADAAIPAQTVSLKPGEIGGNQGRGNGQGLAAVHAGPAGPGEAVHQRRGKRRRLDVEETRFGYRTVKVKGSGLTLNGQPVTFLGTGPNICPAARRRGRHDDCPLPPPLDYIDEVGRVPLSLRHQHLAGRRVGTAQQRPLLAARPRSRPSRRFGSHGSHPSCVGWDITNECYLYACYSVGGEGQIEVRRAAVFRRRRKSASESGRISGSSPTAMGTWATGSNFTSWHYMNQGWSSGYGDGDRRQPRGAHKGLREVAFYAPDSFFVSGAASAPKPDAVVHDTHPADDWHPGMACASTEEFWFTDQNNGPAIAKFLGDQRGGLLEPAVLHRPRHVVGQALHRRLSRHGRQRHGRLRPQFPRPGDAGRHLRHARSRKSAITAARRSTAA